MDRISKIKAFQKSIAEYVKEAFSQEHFISPMAHILFERKDEMCEHGIVPIGEFMTTGLEKNKMVEVLKKISKSKENCKALSCVIVSEAWMKLGYNPDQKSIADDPDRIEVVMINFSNITNEGMTLLKIDRSNKNPILIDIKEINENAFNAGELHGRFYNIIEKEFVN